MLKIYNTLTRRKEDFIPIQPGKVQLYVCGLTVYDYFHMGNARTLTVFDMVSRWLKSSAHNFQVTYVRNITDVDDKIIQRAAENNEPITALTTRMINAMREDTRRLGLEDPTHEPYATQHIEGMVNMISTLVDKNLAYPASNGDVYYAVHNFPGYGKLSGKSLDTLRAGERVDIDTHKKDPLDFVLWKGVKPGEPSWPSPWGAGRPGWHIECSAMSEAVLGQHFDIHGGGEDLQFPHHENEIAQSEGVHGHTFVNYWMHAAFLNIDNEKMSKSLGNFFTTREVLNKFKGQEEAIKFFLLRGHYRSQLNYSEETLRVAHKELDSFYLALREVKPDDIKIDWQDPYAARFKAAMDDDFNTWEAFIVLTELRQQINKTKSSVLAGLLKSLAGVLGFLQKVPDDYLKGNQITANITLPIIEISATGSNELGIDELIELRKKAKLEKNFAEADRIRKKLDAAGVLLEDKPGGITEWRRK